MLSLGDRTEENDGEFNWGRKMGLGGPNKNIQFYASFTYDGVEYFLYDCVYMWREDEPEAPYIGKLVRIWETTNHRKVAKVVWFFRPTEMQHWLGDVKPLENEVFLASGEGIGLYNVNPLEAIAGKCNVVCTSKDERNPQASKEELRMADYVFSRTFDVGRCTISHIFADVIAGIEVKHFFNREKDQKLTASELDPNLKEKITNPSSCVKVKGVTGSKSQVKDDKSNTITKPAPKDKAEMKDYNNLPPTRLSDIEPRKKRKLQFSSVGYKEDHAKLSDTLPRVPDHRNKFMDAPELTVEYLKHSKGDKSNKFDSQFLEVTRRPGEDVSKWFKDQPWEEKMKSAHEKGTLVLLENLDPSYTSSEVEDIVWCAFKAMGEAKVVPRCTSSSPHHGQAFFIFKSKDAAEHAISELNRKCLMLPNGRPLVGRKGCPVEPSNRTRFFGHLVIDKLRFQKQSEDWKNAVSTSHYCQANTIEYDLAVEWLALQAKSELWWDALNKQQAMEMANLLKCQLKIPNNG